ncbi:thiopeptide-type bacteriocin biosynthesis protein [Serratia marcescens]|uniref:thiopeptide-type bacteriocin biosynthesis protein n=1 Tax=Serratia marcescens TaxID=615 RepID=UPI002FDA2DD6
MKNRSASWHFYKLYIGSHHDGMDFLITQGLTQALAYAPDSPWFFLRYIDEKGLHLRVRFLLQEKDSQRLETAIYAALHDALNSLPLRPANLWTPLVSFRGNTPFPTHELPVHCERAEYEPETDVYGGETGIGIAEALFHQSSDIARAILLAEAGGGMTRKEFALPLMLAMLETFIPVARRSAFLESFSTFWLAGSADIGMIKNSFTDRAWELIDENSVLLSPQIRQDSQSAELVDRWQSALDQTRRNYERHCERYSDGLAKNLAFQFMHLMNNRLGLSTLDEAWLAVLLSKSLESGVIHASS